MSSNGIHEGPVEIEEQRERAAGHCRIVVGIVTYTRTFGLTLHPVRIAMKALLALAAAVFLAASSCSTGGAVDITGNWNYSATFGDTMPVLNCATTAGTLHLHAVGPAGDRHLCRADVRLHGGGQQYVRAV